MGNEASLPMEMATNFDAEEIKRLGKRFKKLDLDNSGSLSVDEFMSLPELQQVYKYDFMYILSNIIHWGTLPNCLLIYFNNIE